MLPLGLLSAGEKAEVVELSEGRRLLSVKKGIERSDVWIEDVGIRTGKVVEMLNNAGRGPLLLKIDESRIAIARGLAMKIMVRRKG